MLEIANFHNLTDNTLFHRIPVVNTLERTDGYSILIRITRMSRITSMSRYVELQVNIDKQIRNEDQVLVNIKSEKQQFQFTIPLSEMETYDKFLDAISHITKEMV